MPKLEQLQSNNTNLDSQGPCTPKHMATWVVTFEFSGKSFNPEKEDGETFLKMSNGYHSKMKVLQMQLLVEDATI
jgi:hypothetical protein